jgi:hypothetical protein
MKNVFKTLLLSLHTQILIDVLFFCLISFGISPFTFSEQAYLNTVFYSLFLAVIYFIYALSLSLIKPKVLTYPYKSFILFILLMTLYTLSFALAQKDQSYWRIYWLSHLPVGWFIRSWHPSQFNWIQEFLSGLDVIIPVIGYKFGFQFMTWFNRKIKKAR